MSHSGSISLWLAVGCGGFAGAWVRYALSGWEVHRFPMGTLAVNVAGCLAIGMLMALRVKFQWPGEMAMAFWVPGFLGALTTFSTFGYQTIDLLRQQAPWSAAANIALNVGAGLLAVWLGLMSMESLHFSTGGSTAVDRPHPQRADSDPNGTR